MGFETKIVRQNLPVQTYYPALMGGVPTPMVDGTHKLPLVPPDKPGDWRFSMKWRRAQFHHRQFSHTSAW